MEDAREEADTEYAAAKAFVENAADENDYALLSPERLKEAMKSETPTVLRLDHEKQTFTISDYDAENGILTVFDQNDLTKPYRLFRVTADDIKEITNDTRTKEDAAGTVPADAQASGREQAGEDEAGTGNGSHRGDAGATVPAVLHGRSGEEVWRYETLLRSGGDEEGRRNADVSLLGGNPVSAFDLDYPEVTQEQRDAWEKGVVGEKVVSRRDCANLFARLSNPYAEIAKVLYLGKDGTVLGAKVFGVGTVGETQVDNGLIVKNVPDGTFGVVVSHNHPAGNPMLSMEDRQSDLASFRRRVITFKKAGINYLDDIVTDTNVYTSCGEGFDYVVREKDGSYKSGSFAPSGDLNGESFFKDGGSVPAVENGYNYVPFDQRVSVKEEGIGNVCNNIVDSARLAGSDGSESYVVGISDASDVVSVVRVDETFDGFKRNLGHARRFVVIEGTKEIDRKALSDALDHSTDGVIGIVGVFRPNTGIVAAYWPNTGLYLFNDGFRVNDEYVSYGQKPMSEKTEAPAPKKQTPKKQPAKKQPVKKPTIKSKLDESTAKELGDALDDLGDLLNAPVSPLATKGGVGGIFTGSKSDKAEPISSSFGWGLYGSKRRDTAVNYAGGKNRGTVTEQTWFANREKGDESHLLKWSAPVSAENQKRIRDNWKAEFGQPIPKTVQLTSGASAYRTLQKALGSDVKASMFLNRAGIDGVNSGDLYVTFGTDNVRVDNTWADGELQQAPVEQLSSRENDIISVARKDAERIINGQLKHRQIDEGVLRKSCGRTGRFLLESSLLGRIAASRKRASSESPSGLVQEQTRGIVEVARQQGILVPDVAAFVREKYGRDVRNPELKGGYSDVWHVGGIRVWYAKRSLAELSR